eukprot:jgi/Astpho2/1206/fgenesh1_pg.00022_%23_15_t
MAYPKGGAIPSKATGSAPGLWEDCRREARKIEAELDAKLVSFARVASTYDQTYTRGDTGLAADQAAQTKTADIEALLARLADVNDRLSSALSGSNDSRSHTLVRHREILRDYTQEFRRHKSALGAAQDRATLMSGASERSSLLGANAQSTSSALLRERGQIGGAHQALDDVMGTANAVAGNVKEQSNLFENIGDKVVTLGSKFPAVNAVLNAVRRKKSKDTIILFSVVVVCTLLILIYWINK